MHIASIGIDLGKTLSPGCIGRAEQGSGSQEVLSPATAGLHREPARIADRA
jgi:hypothetical protein